MTRRLVDAKVTRDIVQRHHFRFKKGLGQNFLIDPDILDQIVEAAELAPEDGVIEVGPGIGTLTQALAEVAAVVVAVEKDESLLPVLSETVGGLDHVHINQGDVMQVDLHELIERFFASRRVSVVANLPYYITTPIIMKLLEEQLPLQHIVVMVQKEVAERMAAGPGGKEYGALSVAVQYYTVPKIVCVVPPNSFVPEPGVDSVVIRLAVRERPAVDVHDPEMFFRVVKASFAQRRKTILNNLAQSIPLETPSKVEDANPKEAWTQFLSDLGIDPKRRGETLSLEEFARVANTLHRLPT